MRIFLGLVSYAVGIVSLIIGFGQRDKGHLGWFVAFSLLTVGFCIAGAIFFKASGLSRFDSI